MFRISLLAVAVAPALMSTQAHACVASGPDGYTTGNVWKNKPSNVPTGASIMQVRDLRSIVGSWGFSAMVSEGPASMKGKRHRFISYASTSCNSSGAIAGYVVVSREVKLVGPTIDDEQGFLIAYDYSESWWNWITRLLGMSAWRYAGDPEIMDKSKP